MKVTFCGHSMISDKEELSKKLSDTIEKLIKQGADVFYLGGYGDFDIRGPRKVVRLFGVVQQEKSKKQN